MSGIVTASLRFSDALEAARSRNASDVHLSCGMPPILRIDGILVRTPEDALTSDDVQEIAASRLDEPEMATLRTKGELTVAFEDPEFGTLRIHSYACADGLTLAVRLLNSSVPTLESLRLPEPMNSLPECERGMIVVAGPTGSGKSTTLAGLVDRINERSARRIVTIEDPIEYRHQSRRSLISQREIGRDAPNLGAALRGVLRADPDVIVVGEMRDAESMSEALAAAETGHLVLTTVHAGDAAQTVDRIVDAFSGALHDQVRAQVARVLVAVACQHLVRRNGGNGRRAVVELLFGTDAVRNLIRESKNHQLKNAMATGKRHGMQTLEQHLTELLRNRDIDAHEAHRLGVAAGPTAA